MKDDGVHRELPDSFDERLPPPPPPAPKPRSWSIAIITFLSLSITTILLMGIVPKFAAVFRQVKVPMTPATETLMTLSDAACAHPLVVTFVMILVPASLGRLSIRSASVALFLVPSISLVSWAWMVIALFLPLTVLL